MLINNVRDLWINKGRYFLNLGLVWKLIYFDIIKDESPARYLEERYSKILEDRYETNIQLSDSFDRDVNFDYFEIWNGNCKTNQV